MSLKSILQAIGSFIGKLLKGSKDLIGLGRDLATEIKQIIDNPAFDVAVAFTSTKLDDIALAALRSWVGDLFKALNLADKVETDLTVIYKTASQSIAEMALPEAKAGTLNTIAAAISTKLSTITGGDPLPIETTLTVQQPAYFHPELLAENAGDADSE
jgi:hypothetical protein